MNTAQNHIEKRLQSLGFKDYSLQSLQVDLEPGIRKQIVNTCNEFLFLQNEILPEDIIIHADNDIFCSSIHLNNADIPKEFRGMVYIESTTEDGFILEFIRAIPK